MNTKAFEIERLEGEQDAPGIIAYASTFDREPDSYGDVVAKGAFVKSLAKWQESGNAIPLLYGHVMDNPDNIIGKVVKAEEDERGLLVEALFDMENPQAVKVHRAVLAKTISKLSFAFNVLDYAPVELEDGRKANELRELDIFEVSLVVVPANSHAEVVSAKSDEPEMKSDAEIGADDTAEAEEPEVKAEEPVQVKAEEQKEAEAEAEPVSDNTIPRKENEMEMETVEIIGGTTEAVTSEPKSLSDAAVKSFIGKAPKGEKFELITPAVKTAGTIARTEGLQPAITDFDKNIVSIEQRKGLADLFGHQTITGGIYSFFTLTDKDGAPAAVAEGGQKPQVDYTYTPSYVALQKIAGYIVETEEIMEDANWLTSAIEGRLLWNLSKVKETQLLSGNGSGANLTGILNVSGVGSVTYASTLSIGDIKKAQTKVLTDSGMVADAVVINPADYDALIVDSLSHQYAVNPWNVAEPRLWGMEVYQSADITAGTVLVGAFKQGATIVTKGDEIRVAATNSNVDDFTNNRVTLRAEVRMALATRVPQAFVKITHA